MRAMFDTLKENLKRSAERERKLERPMEAVSRVLWPWPESKLIFYVCLAALMDFSSTFALLTFSRNGQVAEAGLIAKWALQTGGFTRLFLIDAGMIGALILLALGLRALYNRLGFRGFGRTALVFLLIPYFVIIMAVVYNNILLSFL
jgi:hypothetical protein